MTRWKSYEEVATYLLDQFAGEFGLERVEGKQVIRGLQSGTNWEIDAKGGRQNNTGFVMLSAASSPLLDRIKRKSAHWRIASSIPEQQGASLSALSVCKKAQGRSLRQ
jgi:hypothetical protein